jgi:Tfp pilus assembly protein PilX
MRKPRFTFPLRSILSNRPGGFALVATLALMILVTLIAVGMLSLSSILFRKSNLEAAQEQARANARLALMMALGELQEHAGPDQRVTATANLAGAAGGRELPPGAEPQNLRVSGGVSNGLSPVVPGSRHWTGVWRNNSPPTQIFTRTPAPALVSWLVSGNETSASGSPMVTPALEAATVEANGRPGAPDQVAVLVGPGSAGADSADPFVTAPWVDIKPGKGSRLAGRYAWWVGDEGIKARIDMRKTETDHSRSVSLIAQRRGWETVGLATDYPIPGSAGEESLRKVITLNQTSLLGVADSAARGLFHSATSDSRGVISDTLNGGTRIDLTTLLAAGLPSTNPHPTIPHYPTLAGTIAPRSTFRSLRAPSWADLKNFHDLPKTLDGDALVVKSTRLAGSQSNHLPNPRVVGGVSSAAITPIITDFRVLMGVRFITQGTELKTNACGKIAVAIANPYSVPLKWNEDLELHVKNQTPGGNRPSRIWNLGNETAFFNNSDNTAEPAVFNNAYFRIRPGSLEPGEVRAYTHARPNFRDRSNSRIIVELAPFATSRPGDFSNCIELDSTTLRSSVPGMDVRESWQTTLVGLELNLTGPSSSAGLLTAIDRFELDNGYFSPNTRHISLTEAQQLRGPIPLMLYSFSLSQPGMDYVQLMPGGYSLGQRGSTLRTFMDFNLRATRIYKPIASYNPPPYFMECTNSINQLPVGGGGDTGQAFTRDLAIPRWGYSSKTGPGRAVLYDIPDRLVSLAQLQHADLTGDDLSASIGHQPAYAVGNSYASPFVKRSLTIQQRHDYEIIGSPNQSGAINVARNYYDLSYILNASLWDSFFFSSLDAASKQPANPTLIFHGDPDPARLTEPLQPAGALLIDGSFNINSTQKDAWKAFLASGRHFKHPADAEEDPSTTFPRSLRQTASATVPPSGNAADSYSGFRRLSDEQIDELAEQIVRQVRLRGPFVSISHFVNRSLAEILVNQELTRAGALQVAIDESGLNINSLGNRSAFARLTGSADAMKLSEKEGAPRADMDGGDRDHQLPNAVSSIRDWAVTSTDNNYGSVASILADRPMLNNPRLQREQGYRSTGIPGWLTQADILQVIGSAISARSDTFRIRTCGEAVDSSGKVLARAYCEAIVQRVPEYFDPANPASDRGTQLTALNTLYGRQFKIVSFRWLSPREI